MPSQHFYAPLNEDRRFYRVMETDDTDLAVGEIVKLSSNKPTAVGVDETGDPFGVVIRVWPRSGDVTHAEVYSGPRLKMPIDASHHVPGIGDPVYCSSKSGVSADGAGVAANATPIGVARAVSGTAGAGYVDIDAHWPGLDSQQADAS